MRNSGDVEFGGDSSGVVHISLLSRETREAPSSKRKKKLREM